MQTKVITILSFKWWPFWKFLMTVITITRWYVHSWPSIHTISCKYSHADKSYIIFFFNWGYYKIRWYIHTLGMIRYTVHHQYTHFYVNIHMYNKVINILSFQWWPFWKFKMAVTAPARSHVFISYNILIITNFQNTKFHVNIHMHNKVIEIWVFSGGHFENSKWRSLQQPDHVSSFLIWF